MKIQLQISQLERIISRAKKASLSNSSLSHTVEIEVIHQTDIHTGGDIVKVWQKCNYAECNDSLLIDNLY